MMYKMKKFLFIANLFTFLACNNDYSDSHIVDSKDLENQVKAEKLIAQARATLDKADKKWLKSSSLYPRHTDIKKEDLLDQEGSEQEKEEKADHLNKLSQDPKLDGFFGRTGSKTKEEWIFPNTFLLKLNALKSSKLVTANHEDKNYYSVEKSLEQRAIDKKSYSAKAKKFLEKAQAALEAAKVYENG